MESQSSDKLLRVDQGYRSRVLSETPRQMPLVHMICLNNTQVT